MNALLRRLSDSHEAAKLRTTRVGVEAWRFLPAFTALVLVAICLVFTFVMSGWHRDVGRALAASGEGVAALVAGEIDHNIELLDFSLRGVVEAWNIPDVQALSPSLRDRSLFDNAMRAPGFGMLVVLDQDGRLAARSPEWGRLGDDMSDRDYFRVHRFTSNMGIYVSKPFLSRMTGTWIVALSRRIDDTAGNFAGVAMGTLDLAYLGKLYGGLRIGGESAVTLFRTDGTVITREPFESSHVRLFAGGDDTFTRMRSSRDGTIEGASPVDGRRRIISFHRVGHLPLIQAVEVGGEEDYAAWWRRAAAVAGLLTLLCIGVLGLSLALTRELGRRSAAEAKLSLLAETDPLTGLANRRRFDATLAETWAHAKLSGEPVTLLMIDADSFKSYNDTYGHPAGDRVLQAIAGRFDAGARARGGLASRCGGEEFAVLIPGCDEARALRIAEELRASVEGLALPHSSSAGGIVTISVGVASACPTSSGPECDLPIAADAALYRAKADGRNRCRAGQGMRLHAA